MRKILLFTLAFSILFVGCKKEGVYNPNKKIKRIYYEYGLNTGTKTLSQEWTWEKDKLVKIKHSFYTEILSYDNKNRLIKIQDFDFNDRYEIIYDKKLISKIEYYIGNSLCQTMNFKYDKDKIVEITIVDIDNNKMIASRSTKPDSFISTILPFEIPENSMRTKSAISSTYIITYEYDGDNISKTKYIDDDNQVHEYTQENYDNKLNPFYNSRFLSNGIGIGFSKNNVGKATTIASNNDVKTIEFEYVYDGKFPTEVIEKESSSATNEFSINKTYYEYQ
ncbi:MAG TPA: hypothetical protein PLG05_07715 [Bacteroidales bacterium]|nr:hypothetical protein [Bacteroidales bacterium]HPL05048.1 hypothetical protein [Bacteroidales bacterium]